MNSNPTTLKNSYLSSKLKAISFLMMVLVVFIHSHNLDININSKNLSMEKGFNFFIQNFISRGIAEIAVPMFFIISGYLFFLSMKSGKVAEFLPKLKKRTRTLVTPYLLWSIFGILFFLVLQSISISKPFFNNELICEYSLTQILSRIFINPIPHQFWFIRDLIVLVSLSPILFLLIKYSKLFIIITFFATWTFSVNYIIFTSGSLFFFALGAYLGVNKIDIQKKLINNYYFTFTISWILLVFAKTTLIYSNSENQYLIRSLNILSIMIGLLAIWFLYDKIFKDKDISQSKIYYLFQFNFFLYAFHEPTLTILKKASYYFLGQSQIASLTIYFTTAIITIALSLLIGNFTKKTIPMFYSLITGKR